MTRIVVLFAVLVSVIAGAAAATQVEYRSPRDLGREATLVVEGTVASSRSYWNASGTKILTETTISVSATHKGAPRSSVRVVQLGGVVGNVRQTVAGALSWRPGEEVVLFLEAMPGGGQRVSGFSQGKFRVERDPDTGRAFIQSPPLDGVELVGAPDGALPRGKTEKVTVDRFISQALGRR